MSIQPGPVRVVKGVRTGHWLGISQVFEIRPIPDPSSVIRLWPELRPD
jgi:hypothetical protein